jgi:DNA topoisomerase-3
MKSLVLAEKPSVAKEIARVLKCNVKNKGYLEGQKYVVTWALGHLVTLAEPEYYNKSLKTWRMEDLPMIPDKMKLKVIKQTSNQFNTVKNLMKRNDLNELIVATDAGREGELVARWIMILGGWKKPFYRLWISSQTDKAILDGFKNLKPGRNYDNLFDAAVARSEADWLIGLNVTRALTCKFNAQLTAGRVQTPTLAMIIDREEEIKKFVPKDYWTVRVDFDDYFGDWQGKNGQMRIFDYSKAQEIESKVKGHNVMGIIKEVRNEPKQKLPPLAYDLTELQRDANKRYSFSASKTLSVLQGLYEHHKIVTYPRTDSRYITPDIVPTLQSRLNGMATGPYKEIAKPLLNAKLNPGKRFVDSSKVSDHHAIIPTEEPLKLSNLDNDEKRLYDLIAKRFIEVLYPPYKYEQTTIVTDVNGESFISRGNIVKDIGWKAVKGNKKDEKDEDIPEQNLTLQEKGSKKIVKDIKINKSKTKPPAHYTEATLLTSMEGAGKFIEDEELRESIKQGGIGTPATRADIIEKLLYNNYIERNGRDLIPTSKGMQLIGLVPSDLRSPELTARWELRLSEIAKGNEKKDAFIKDIRENTIELVKGVKSDDSTYKPDNVTKNKCPMCGKYMLLINSKKGKMLCCQDPSCGYRQKENENKFGNMKISKGESRFNQKLISKYSNNNSVGNSLGDLLKEAMKDKN